MADIYIQMLLISHNRHLYLNPTQISWLTSKDPPPVSPYVSLTFPRIILSFLWFEAVIKMN